MPSKDTKVISIRVPNRIEFEDISLAKLIVNIYELRKCGAIEIVENELVLPEIKESDGWGEIEDICHERNISIEAARKKIKQMLYNG